MGGVAKVASMDKYILPNMAKGLRYAAVKPLEKVVAPIIIGAWSRTNPIKVAKQLPPFSEWRMLTKTNPNKVTSEIKSLDDFLSNFRSFADDTIEMGLIKEELKNTIKGKSRRINKALDDLDEAYYELDIAFQGKYNKGITSRVGQNYDLDKVMEYLKGQRKLSDLPKEYHVSAKDINNQLEELREGLSKALPNNAKFADFKKDLFFIY